MSESENANEKLPREKKSLFPQFGKAIIYGLLISVLIALIVLNQYAYSFGGQVMARYVSRGNRIAWRERNQILGCQALSH